MNTAAEFPNIQTELTEGVLHITLGRAPAHALSLAMIRDLHDALRRAEADAEVRAVVIEAPGRIFCAGHDLKEISRHRQDDDAGAAFVTELFGACSEMMLALAQLPVPTLAMVEGIATAAGLQLLASCDVVFATPDARFQLPGINNGGFCTTPAVAVSRAIGQKPLMELLLSGAPMDADWALRQGLITRVVPPEALREDTLRFATEIAGRNPQPIRDGLAALHAHLHLPLDEAYAVATPVMVGHFMDEGRKALEKVSPFHQAPSER